VNMKASAGASRRQNPARGRRPNDRMLEHIEVRVAANRDQPDHGLPHYREQSGRDGSACLPDVLPSLSCGDGGKEFARWRRAPPATPIQTARTDASGGPLVASTEWMKRDSAAPAEAVKWPRLLTRRTHAAMLQNVTSDADHGVDCRSQPGGSEGNLRSRGMPVKPAPPAQIPARGAEPEFSVAGRKRGCSQFGNVAHRQSLPLR